ncbi:MAG: sugar phosphate nucleotidyltransferase [Microthrixaceae bacterium]
MRRPVRGLGTRLGEFGRHRPKHLVPVLGRPFAHRQLEWLAEQGVTDVVECIGHLGDEIRSAVGDGSAFGLSVAYSADGATLRPGTGGALVLAHRRGLLQQRFLVLYGDSWLRMSLRDLVEAADRTDTPATMAVLDNRNGREPSNAEVHNGLVRYSKDGRGAGRTHIDYGVSVLDRELLDRLDDGGEHPQCDLADAVAAWSADGLVSAFEVRRPYDEVGTPEGVARLEAALLAEDG